MTRSAGGLLAPDQMAGSLTDVYERGYLDRLRDEWRSLSWMLVS
jgi:hypothetical protein